MMSLPFVPLLRGARKARIAFTMDLEMSRNFPTWDQTHWDFEKGNLDPNTKRYALEAARRVRDAGGCMHFFVVGRVFEQEDVGWLREIVTAGHSIGNHTYDHVYLLAKNAGEIQPRFARSPWLIEGKTVEEVLRENIRMTNAALLARLGTRPNGFRAPGGFVEGLGERPDLQRMLKEFGFTWISSLYPRHALRTSSSDFENILSAARRAQPFRYPESGLIEIPMSPISDIGAFRNGRWPLDAFLGATRAAIVQAIETGGTLDILCHPSCIGIVDPTFRTIEMITSIIREARDRAEMATLDTIAAEVAA